MVVERGVVEGFEGVVGRIMLLRFVGCGWWREGALRTWDAVSNDVYLPTFMMFRSQLKF